MKRIALIAAVGVLLALSAHSAAESTTPPTPQESKAETFLLVKVQGTIGEDFTAAKMKAAISEARTAKAAALVLSMDTPGGSVTEAEAIVNLIIENKDLRFIALVNKALSAGAAITLACKEIYVMETATIGAAVSYIPDKRGLPTNLPADVAEKFQSAWRAVCRKAADHGGHSSLLAEGMADPGFAITKRTENGKVILERDGKGELVKASGRILTLTAKEAVAWELAKVVVPDVAVLKTKLGLFEYKSSRVQPTPERKIPAENANHSQTLRLPELNALLYKYVDIESKGTSAAATQQEKEIIGRTLELGGVLVDAVGNAEGLRVCVHYVSANKVYTSWGYDGRVFAPLPQSYPCPVEAIEIRMTSANKRWVSAKKGSRVLVTGRISDIKIRYHRLDGPSAVILLKAEIVMEELQPNDATERSGPAREPKSTAYAPVDAEAEARKQLNLAENYRSAGLASKALGILRTIIEDFPNTSAAKEAKEQVKQLQDEAKKASKGS